MRFKGPPVKGLSVLILFSLTVGCWLFVTTDQSLANGLTIDNTLLRKLLPMVKAPRLMTLDDLREWEKRFFKVDGLSFVLEGDFDKDGQRDYAAVGKDDSADPESSAFILILTAKDGLPIIRHFWYLYEPRVSLTLRPNCLKGFDAIDLVFTPRSDHGIYLVWDGKKYTTVEVCDQ